jgi:flagellar FliL protein
MNMIIVAVISIVVCLGAGAAVIFLTPLKNVIFHTPDAHPKKEKKEEEVVNLLEISFVQLPELIVNLKQNAKGHTNILKATFMLELVEAKEKETIDHLKPLIVDQLQIYLRELSASDLEGTAGIERVRHELKNRVANLVAPVKVRNILYKEFLVQ